jgi:hypothetical protein
MLATWLQDLESLEAISQDDLTRDVCLKMASPSQTNSLGPFLVQLRDDRDLDDKTKGMLTELAEDRSFLLAVEDYVHKTEIVH